jgi:plastocyanin
VRRALLPIAILLVAVLTSTPTARAATTHTVTITSGQPSPNPTELVVGDMVRWNNDDAEAHTIKAEGNDIATIGAGETSAEFSFDEGQYDYSISGTVFTGSGSIVVSAPPTSSSTTSTTTTSTTSTTKPTTTSSGNSTTTTSTSSTTTTSSSTTSTTTTTTRPFSSGSGAVNINDKGGSGGGSSALPLLVGAFVVVAGLAGLAYWLWQRSGTPYDDEDEGPDWTDEPPTVQGPRY